MAAGGEQCAGSSPAGQRCGQPPAGSEPAGGCGPLYAIGHSAHAIERFLGLLAAYGIQLVVDVRSHPASRFHPQFRQRPLQQALAEAGIGYVFLGRELGGRPDDPACYRAGVPDWARMMQREPFVAGVQRLLSLAAEQRTVILCSEEDPTRCHRQHLIAAFLREAHPEVAVRHIRGDGRVEEAGQPAGG